MGFIPLVWLGGGNDLQGKLHFGAGGRMGIRTGDGSGVTLSSSAQEAVSNYVFQRSLLG